MLCILGDIHQDEKYYIKALVVSNGRCIRALRALGMHHFMKKDYAKSLEYFRKATDANDFDLTSWLKIGFMHMNS